MIRFSNLETIMGGQILQLASDDVIQSLSIDSRKVISLPGVLFFAIHGVRHDGHEFLPTLYATGTRQFVVERPPQHLEDFPGANIILVRSCTTALQSLASFHRRNFTIPIIGITGSNGKTIIKEWLFQLLSKDQTIVKNPGSYNSQIGVPLSVWHLQPHHTLGIFEAGISKPGEMESIREIMRPTIGIFINIGTAHDEGFKDRSQKIAEKLKLFSDAEVIIYCADHEAIHSAILQSGIKSFSWGHSPGADLQVVMSGSSFVLTYRGKQYPLSMPFSAAASIENCLHCVSAMLYLGYSVGEIQQRIQGLRAVSMRMELKEGIHHCQLIDDTYNNDLGGLQIALEFLTNQHQKKKKRLILSDMLESGLADEVLAEQIAEQVDRTNLHAFVGIGPVLKRFSHLFPPNSAFFLTTDDFLHQFDTVELQHEMILVKGARIYEFEKIVRMLQRKVHGTVMEIDLNALIHNLNYFKAQLNSHTKIMLMVKAFAYGSGSIEIANLLQYHRVDYLGVAYADEGIELRNNNISLPIMVMNPSEESFDTLVRHQLEPELYSLKIFRAYLQFLQGKESMVHLKLDTGMHRLGFASSDLGELIQLLQTHPHIRVASIFTHLAAADDPIADSFSHSQAEAFIALANKIADALRYKPLYHMLNSAGILRLPELQLDMVRLGIGLYGIDPTSTDSVMLRPVATLKTMISQIKQIRAGETVGYGRKGVAIDDMRIATIAIGYADGFSRAHSNGVGEVMVHGKRAPVIGNVCMDMTMIDITGIAAKEGDEVIVFGEGYSIQEVAAKIHTIPYEILTNTSERIKRIFLSDGI